MLVALPPALVVAAMPTEAADAWAALWGLITYSGGSFLLAQLARDFGRAKQKHLFATWGGAPTTQRLRHQGHPNPITRGRYH